MSEPRAPDPKPRVRMVRISIEVLGATDRDAWEWGDAIARSLRTDFKEGGEDFGPVAVQCFDVEDPAKEGTR